MLVKNLHWLTGGIFLLSLANIINDLSGRPFYSITKMIYFSWESTIPTWYSSMLFAIGAYLAYQCFLKAKNAQVINYYAFLLFALLLITMSCDEVAQFHETFGAALGKNIFGIVVKQGEGMTVSTAWVWGGGLVVISIFVVCFLYVIKPIMLVPAAAKLLPIGLILIVFGGVVLEASTNFLKGDGMQWVFDAEVIAEETLELLGAMLIVYAFAVWFDRFNVQENLIEKKV